MSGARLQPARLARDGIHHRRGLLIAAALNAGPELGRCSIQFCVTRLQRQSILSTETGYTSRQSLAMVPTIMCGQMKKVGLADQRTSNGLPSASDPETEADRTPRESSLACMTANREPRLIKALKLTGRRRFALRAVASCYLRERQSNSDKPRLIDSVFGL